jgi:phosphate starvation-inducible protein PhoH and related proteins
MSQKRKKKLSREEEDEILESMRHEDHSRNPLQINIDVKCKTDNQKKFTKLIKEKEIVIAAGFAGTGKTFLSCVESLKLLKSDPKFRKIMLVKSVTGLQGEDIGFLKGELKDKMAPYMDSFKDNFRKIIGKAATDKLQEMGLIEIQPLSFVRGRTIDNTIMIIDEAQNISLDNMKTMLTRIGENSKIIVIGDTKQIDLKNKKISSLLSIMEKFKDKAQFGVMQFEKSDQVRNPIISIIEDVFDELEK